MSIQDTISDLWEKYHVGSRAEFTIGHVRVLNDACYIHRSEGWGLYTQHDGIVGPDGDRYDPDSVYNRDTNKIYDCFQGGGLTPDGFFEIVVDGQFYVPDPNRWKAAIKPDSVPVDNPPDDNGDDGVPVPNGQDWMMLYTRLNGIETKLDSLNRRLDGLAVIDLMNKLDEISSKVLTNTFAENLQTDMVAHLENLRPAINDSRCRSIIKR